MKTLGFGGGIEIPPIFDRLEPCDLHPDPPKCEHEFLYGRGLTEPGVGMRHGGGGMERHEGICNDGVDNDDDGSTDRQNPDCMGQTLPGQAVDTLKNPRAEQGGVVGQPPAEEGIGDALRNPPAEQGGVPGQPPAPDGTTTTPEPTTPAPDGTTTPTPTQTQKTTVLVKGGTFSIPDRAGRSSSTPTPTSDCSPKESTVALGPSVLQNGEAQLIIVLDPCFLTERSVVLNLPGAEGLIVANLEGSHAIDHSSTKKGGIFNRRPNHL